MIKNERLLLKLAARGETLEERQERRAQKRAAQIQARFGYTADENPFNDPNLHETFTWTKREAKIGTSLNHDQNTTAALTKTKKKTADHTFDEIDKVRRRREERDLQMQEMERIRAEESRMKELENYDEWARKEEEFHLQQQRHRSAIRLVEGREKPIDVLAKNLLLFGLSDEEKRNRAAVKYQEKYNALQALENLEAELDEPQVLLKGLKLDELEELLIEIEAFRTLEREALLLSNPSGYPYHVEEAYNTVLRYWDALMVVTKDEIKYLKDNGSNGSHAQTVAEIQKIFVGQSDSSLLAMKEQIEAKIERHAGRGRFVDDNGNDFDQAYWKTVVDQLHVHLAKKELSDLHSKMLVRQLEKLESMRDELANQQQNHRDLYHHNHNTNQDEDRQRGETNHPHEQSVSRTSEFDPDLGDLEEELGLTDQVDLHAQSYGWGDKYRPRKPRFYNRVRTGYDWNSYNKTQ
jgi:hypothetical protein